MNDLITEANFYKYKNYEKKIKKEKELLMTDLYILNSEKNNIIGGCPRQAWFRSVGYTFSNDDFYKIEKNIFEEYILKYTLNKIKELFNFEKKESSDLDYICFKENKIKFNNTITFNENNKNIALTVIKMKNSKLTNEENNFLVFLPFAILALMIFDKYILIEKNVYTLEEKTICFERINNNLFINGENKGIQLINAFKEIADEINNINKSIKEKTIPTLVNIKYCKKCLWKNFCKTL